jgi:hypothetical protein
VLSLSSIVFRFLGESFSLQHPEDFLFCLPVAHSCLHEGKDRLIHELINLRELPCDFLLVHSKAKTGKSPSDLAIVLWR